MSFYLLVALLYHSYNITTAHHSPGRPCSPVSVLVDGRNWTGPVSEKLSWSCNLCVVFLNVSEVFGHLQHPEEILHRSNLSLYWFCAPRYDVIASCTMKICSRSTVPDVQILINMAAFWPVTSMLGSTYKGVNIYTLLIYCYERGTHSFHCGDAPWGWVLHVFKVILLFPKIWTFPKCRCQFWSLWVNSDHHGFTGVHNRPV